MLQDCFYIFISNFNSMILENAFVRLEVLRAEHFQYLENFIYQVEIWEYSSVEMKTESDLQNYLNFAIKCFNEESQLPFVVYDKTNQRYVGLTRLYEINNFNKSAKLGYTWYDKVVHGTKINKSCKLLLLDYAFNEMGLYRVEFNADTRNEKSIYAMKSIGAEVEGILRSHIVLPNGYRRDTIVLSILKEDWNKKIRKQLIDKIL